MIRDLNKLEQVLSTISCQQLDLLFQDKNDQANDLDEAISCIRYAIAASNKDKLLNHFTVYETRNWRTLEDFIDNHTYICHHLGIAVRRFNGMYYAVEILNPDSCFGGILTTDAPDNYPTHRFPKDMICSEYPEIAMLKVIEDYEKHQEG